MNNSDFGYDCRNNLDNCKFVPMFDEYEEINFVSRYHSLFDSKVRQFITSNLLKKDIEKKFNDKLSKLDKQDKFLKSNYKQITMKDCNKLNQQKNLKNETKKKKQEKKQKKIGWLCR